MAKSTKIIIIIKKLQQLLRENKIDSYLIPVNDEFHSSFNHSNRLQYITNFSGSAGVAIITTKLKHYFFTDGRYTEQATHELDKNFTIIDRTKFPLEKWLVDFMNKGNSLGFDYTLHSTKQIQYLQKHLTNKHNLLPIKKNLVDTVRPNHELEQPNTISLHDLKYAGQTTNAKKKFLCKHLKENELDALILTDTTSICWLLNIRSLDIPFTPCMNAYLIIHVSGKLELFTDASANHSTQNYLTKNNIAISSIASFKKALNLLKNKSVQISDQSPFFIAHNLKHPIIAEDPCSLLKACKNNTELQGAISAGIKDSKALINFFNWLQKEHSKKTLTELDISDALITFRKKQINFISPSFPSIVGFNENSALIHYLPKKSSNKKIKGNGILLIDSGGQYLEGTTDTTRTIAIGKPTLEQIHNFTLVLKGHINLTTAIFPEGTCGSQLDALARMYLWHEGKDYAHGTGHGVGSFLKVHEGPQGISQRYATTPLKEGMIVSIEPGFYKSKSYGIRIENLVYIKKSKFTSYLAFEVLTYVPIDEKLVNFKLLTKKEADWLKNYNKKCYEIFNSS